MVNPESGPFLFDTSAESWLARNSDPAVRSWWRECLSRFPVNVSSVVDRVRGYALLWRRAADRQRVEAARVAYLSELEPVWAVDGAGAVVGGEIMALIPDPPTPPKRARRLTESRQERLVRWRFDALIAATALVANLPLIHNNPADFEAIRVAIEREPGRFPGLGPLGLVRCGALV